MVFTNEENFFIQVGSIPFNKGTFQFGFKHVCIYAFNKEDLDLFSKILIKQCLKLKKIWKSIDF